MEKFTFNADVTVSDGGATLEIQPIMSYDERLRILSPLQERTLRMRKTPEYTLALGVVDRGRQKKAHLSRELRSCYYGVVSKLGNGKLRLTITMHPGNDARRALRMMREEADEMLEMLDTEINEKLSEEEK